MSDITLSIESEPQMNTQETRKMLAAAGDEFFHKNIVSMTVYGDADVEGAPGHVEVTLDQREGGRLEGMKTEFEFYIPGAMDEREETLTNFSVSVVPTDEEVEAALEGVEA